jgi:hypothetical protein
MIIRTLSSVDTVDGATPINSLNAFAMLEVCILVDLELSTPSFERECILPPGTRSSCTGR